MEHFLRDAGLPDKAILHDDNPVAESHGFGPVMCDTDECRIDAKPDDLSPHPVSQFCVKAGQGFIHQDDQRGADNRPKTVRCLWLPRQIYRDIRLRP